MTFDDITMRRKLEKKISIIKDLLLRLLIKLNRNSRDKTNIYAVFALTFTDFFRINEFIYASSDANDFAR